jgi:hypothetical protein
MRFGIGHGLDPSSAQVAPPLQDDGTASIGPGVEDLFVGMMLDEQVAQHITCPTGSAT